MSVLLLNQLQAVLQSDDLIHVVVLRHGVILLLQPFFIKLDQLRAIALLEALEHIVAVAWCLRHR